MAARPAAPMQEAPGVVGPSQARPAARGDCPDWSSATARFRNPKPARPRCQWYAWARPRPPRTAGPWRSAPWPAQPHSDRSASWMHVQCSTGGKEDIEAHLLSGREVTPPRELRYHRRARPPCSGRECWRPLKRPAAWHLADGDGRVFISRSGGACGCQIRHGGVLPDFLADVLCRHVLRYLVSKRCIKGIAPGALAAGIVPHVLKIAQLVRIILQRQLFKPAGNSAAVESESCEGC